MTNAEAWFNIALRPRKPEGSLVRTAQDGHHDSHTAPELCVRVSFFSVFIVTHASNLNTCLSSKMASLFRTLYFTVLIRIASPTNH